LSHRVAENTLPGWPVLCPEVVADQPEEIYKQSGQGAIRTTIEKGYWKNPDPKSSKYFPNLVAMAALTGCVKVCGRCI
jgi:hypothetical protein